MSPRRVAVFMGGPSAEHEVSLNSGAQVMNALRADDPVSVVIGKDGAFTVGGQRASSLGQAFDQIRSQVDVVFIALHGPYGEDGTVQGLLEVLGLPYTGSGVAGSALAMDKIRTKYVYRQKGLPTSDFVVFEPGVAEAPGLAEVERTLGFPTVVKPSKNGSSVGVSFPKDKSALEREVKRLLAEQNEVLVERYVKGRELTCGVLESAAEGWQRAMPVTEIIPAAKYEFFDYEAKYTPGASNEVTPAEIPNELRDRVQALALAAHRALGCRDFSRSDVMIDPERGPMILETNTIPGLTKTSLLPQAAAVAGIDFPVLVRLLVDNARRRRS